MRRREFLGQVARTFGLYTLTTLPTFGSDYVFTCGNHHPPHSAASPEEALALTLKYHCENWDIAAINGEQIPPAKHAELLCSLEKMIAKAREKETKTKAR
jgi:hypothetical protein